jgi:riboflavin biosynthesis pyrimidine reductase
LLETGFTLTKQLAQEQLIDHAAVTVTGAADVDSALNSLSKFSRLAGLEYLKFESHVWLENTLFARFQR